MAKSIDDPTGELSKALWHIYNRNVRFACPDRSHPLVQWLDDEWYQLSTNRRKPTLLIVDTRECFAGSWESPRDEDPSILFIESWLLKRLTVDMLRATLSHEIDHQLRRPRPDLRTGEYLADATAAMRAGKENMMDTLKVLRGIERRLGVRIMYPPPIDSRIEALESETYLPQAVQFYETKLPTRSGNGMSGSMRNISRI
jgi:hypothetical protein